MKNNSVESTHKDINIRISEESKIQFDWIKKTYDFNSFSETIKYMHRFFSNNDISPRDNVANFLVEKLHHFQCSVMKIENFIDLIVDKSERVSATDFKKLVTNIKSIENNLLTPMNRKLNIIFDVYNENAIEKRNQLLLEKQKEPNIIRDKEQKIRMLENELTSQKLANEQQSRNIGLIDQDIKFYRELLQNIRQHSEIKKPFIGNDQIVLKFNSNYWNKILNFKEVFSNN